MVNFLRRRRRRFLTAVSLFGAPCLLVFLFPGCQASYLSRQFAGALNVLWHRQPIDSRLLDRLPPEQREKMIWVGRVREFAARELGLEPGDSYTTYYDTGGKPISTIVCAAHPLALEPYCWSFPIAGRVPYKGYFNPDEARAERDRLQSDGWDAVCRPVQAFSTLGWFSDPVLSTMLNLSHAELADLLLHEMTHGTIYFPNNTKLNESLATAVARSATELLLAEAFGPASNELRLYREELAEDDLRAGLLHRLWGDLDALYRSPLSVEEKLSRKKEMFSTANRELRGAGQRGIEPSNALLILGRQYTGLVPLLEEAQVSLGGHPRHLIAALKEVKGSPEPLAALAARVTALSSISEHPPGTARE